MRARLRVLSMPFRTDTNRYFQLFVDALESEGIQVLGVRGIGAPLLRFDVLHIHFPAFFYHRRSVIAAVFWSAIFIASLVFLRLLGKRIVYSVHDVDPHLSPYYRAWIVRPYIAAFHRLCHAFVFLSRTSQADFYSRFPDQRHKLCSLIGHPPYPATLMTPEQKLKARAALHSAQDSFLVGFLGEIKPYKGLEVISSLPTSLSNGKNVIVVAAGKVEAAFQDTAQRILSEFPSDRLVRIDQRLSDPEMDELIQCLDVILLSYSSISNSGFALLALSNRAQILASDLPLFRELQEDVGRPWIYCYDAASAQLAASLSNQLESLSQEPVSEHDQQRLTKYLDDVSFASSAHEFRKLYERTLLPFARSPKQNVT